MGKDRTLEIIKTEIERRLKNGEKKILLGESNPYYDTAVMSTLANLLSFISSLESEKPMEEGLEEEIEKRYDQAKWGYVDGFGEVCMDKDQFIRIARHFAQWGAEHAKIESEKPVPADLEEAAKKFVGYDMDCDELRDYEIGIAAFIAGAKWDREQMMKEAVEGRVFMSFAPGHNQMVMADVDLPTNTKVRVIICKKED